LRLGGERRHKQDGEDKRKDERSPDLHGTPSRRRWDAATVGRQAERVKALANSGARLFTRKAASAAMRTGATIRRRPLKGQGQ